jgi:two-component system, NarL family, sensor histidine kinase UhpB
MLHEVSMNANGWTREKFPAETGRFPKKSGISPGGDDLAEHEGFVMYESPTHSQPSGSRSELPWRDTAAVIAITVLSVAVAVHFDLNEALYALTRRGERFQIDELPIGMLVLLICLVWLSWRRYRHARSELHAREMAEARLARVVAENRELAQENLRIQEAERKHLARELHDELGQYLNAIKLDAVSICERRGANPEPCADASLSIIRTVDHVQDAVSGMIARLRPVGLDELGLLAAVEHCVDQWRQRLPDTKLSLSVSGNFEDLGEPVNLTIYRLIQESLTNICKHAQARQVEIALQRVDSAPGETDELRLTVADDGCGMQANARTSRFGLSGMRERVEMGGGSFVLESAPGRGVRLEAHLPVNGSRHG